jgi:hypothetical protein
VDGSPTLFTAWNANMPSKANGTNLKIKVINDEKEDEETILTDQFLLN